MKSTILNFDRNFIFSCWSCITILIYLYFYYYYCYFFIVIVINKFVGYFHIKLYNQYLSVFYQKVLQSREKVKEGYVIIICVHTCEFVSVYVIHS